MNAQAVVDEYSQALREGAYVHAHNILTANPDLAPRLKAVREAWASRNIL